jgi:formylglycine-generating enzyme required for sulfatase activity/serine/threonine protein kinase
MSVTGTLAAFALKHTFDLSADTLVDWLQDRFTDHSQTLPKALGRANHRAWQAVGLALAGDGLVEKVKDLGRDRDLTAAREAIRGFLANTPTGLEMSAAGLRVRACDELNRLRKLGKLTAPHDRNAVVANLSRFGNTGRMVGEAAEAVAVVADGLAPDAPHLAQVLRLAPPGGPPLLVTAFLFFIRREVETNDELARGLTFDHLRQLTAAQDRGFALLDARTEGILDQFDVLFDALGNWFAVADEKLDDIRGQLDKLLADRNVPTRAADPLRVSVTNEKELSQLRHWRDELRKLPPELLMAADWSKLGDALASGRLFAEARESHKAAAANAQATKDRVAEAEAEFKAYRDACEQEKWEDALKGLMRAAELDPARFAPFPLNRYEPVGILGAGGFGTVIRCRQRLAKGRDVAVKTFHAADVGRGMDEVFAEAHALSRLADPAIVKVLHWEFADPAESRPFLVMEYFPGMTLAAHLKHHGPLPIDDFLPVARQIAGAMVAAHAANILHRDLKPGNILVSRDGVGRWDVRVIDFGLAVPFTAVQASASTSQPQRTRRDQSFAGTLEYASPEQRGLFAATVGLRSDVYSFGKTMLEALFGSTDPVSEDWEAVPEVYRERLKRALEKCVVRDPSRRHDGFGSIVAALAALEPRKRVANESDQALEEKPPTDPPPAASVREQPVTPNLDVFALMYTFDEPADDLASWLENPVTNENQLLQLALSQANERAWESLGITLAEDGAFDKFKGWFRDSDLTIAREAIRRFLAATPTGMGLSPAELRGRARDELNRLEKAGRLSPPHDPVVIAATLRGRKNAAEMVADAEEAVSTIAAILADDASHVAQLIRLTPPGGAPLLLSVFTFFFRREVESHETLACRFRVDSRYHPAKGQDRGFALFSSRTAVINDLAEREQVGRMERWKQSGMPREWVLKRLDGWGKPALAEFIAQLQATSFWPLKADDVAIYLESLRSELRPKVDVKWPVVPKREEAGAPSKSAGESHKGPALDPARQRKAGEKITFKIPGEVKMAFAWCPPGVFLMGSEHLAGSADEKPAHNVTLTKGFFIGVHPVTQSQWKAITGENPSKFKGDNRPVEMVSWENCQDFCKKLTAQLKGRLTVRLPSEAEWEYACRAGTTSEYHFGDVINPDLANYDAGYSWNGSPKGKYRQETTDVGSFPANPWGLFDVHGNVWEWCEDWYGPYVAEKQTDPIQSQKHSEDRRVMRGGSWYNNPGRSRAAYRERKAPSACDSHYGFRVCFDLG